MRIAVTGATGNVGVALLRALDRAPAVEEVVAIARRAPASPPAAKARFSGADIAEDDLAPALRGCAALVHLAWQIQPMRDRARLRRVNVDGTARVLRAAAEAGVPVVVHASSIGAYSPAPPGTRVDESWPTGGIPTSQYSVDKAACERLLDRFEDEHPGVRVARLRPTLIFQRESATEQVEIFAGRGRVPRPLVGRGLPPGLLPLPPGLRLQAVHADDVADAYVRAVLRAEARGPYNVAAEPVLGPRRLAALVNAVPVPVPARLVRGAVAAAYRLRLLPTEPGWFDMGMETPLLDCSRIRRELGWLPQRTGEEAIAELLDGIRSGARGSTPPLAGASAA